MGWTDSERPRGLTPRQFFEREFPLGLTRDGEVLADASAPATEGSAWYAAVRNKANGKVWALVILTRTHGGRCAYKDMSEDMGPAEHSCPNHILDLLTPAESDYAREWRERCRAYNAAEAAKPKVKEGDRVKFAQPLEFSNGDKLQELTLQSARRAVFTDANGRAYRLGRSWKRDYSFEVVA